ncbi:MAG: hypothetical protein GC151_14535 [Betaproteobacteria bacterium]|nr:hypothetical protein [Betaproteobacteria bacterium]
MTPLSNQQRLHLINSQQLYENFQVALRHARSHRYGMRWKRIRNVEYLFRGADRFGRGKLLGRRSPETERILAAFQEGKTLAEDRVRAIRTQLDEQARLNRALRIARVPRVIGRILREIDAAGLSSAFTVLGTQAMYAYESEGGVPFLLELLASGDVDPLFDPRSKITLVSKKLDGAGLLGLLRKADRSFECIRKRGFRAANAGQFMVDLIVPPRSMQDGEPITFASDDLVAAEVPGLQWLINAPKLETCAISDDGWPAPFRVPDPRAFAMHKAWLAAQPDREPLKKPRDLAQAKAVTALVTEYMPHLPFDETMTSLHGDVRALRSVLGV